MTFMTIPAIGTIADPFEQTTVKAEVSDKSGLYHEGSDWNYYENGEIATDKTTLVKYNGSWWYVNGGKIDFSAATVVKYAGTWYYVDHGRVNWKATGLCKYNGTWWYVNKGCVDFSGTETLVKYGSNWYCVKQGQVFWGKNGTVEYNKDGYMVKNGVVDFSAGANTAKASTTQSNENLPELYTVYYDNWGIPYAYVTHEDVRTESAAHWDTENKLNAIRETQDSATFVDKDGDICTLLCKQTLWGEKYSVICFQSYLNDTIDTAARGVVLY